MSDRGRGGGQYQQRGQQSDPWPCRGCGLSPGQAQMRGDYCVECRGLAEAGKAVLSAESYPDYFRLGLKDRYGRLVMDREYIDRIPHQLALYFATEGGRVKLTKHQLRAFYNEAKRINSAVRTAEDYLPMANRVGKLAANAQARFGRENIPASFKVFIERNAGRVKDKETLAAFTSHFESVVAYCEGRLKDKEGR